MLKFHVFTSKKFRNITYEDKQYKHETQVSLKHESACTLDCQPPVTNYTVYYQR